jgi:hypothetical protein
MKAVECRVADNINKFAKVYTQTELGNEVRAEVNTEFDVVSYIEELEWAIENRHEFKETARHTEIFCEFEQYTEEALYKIRELELRRATYEEKKTWYSNILKGLMLMVDQDLAELQ